MNIFSKSSFGWKQKIRKQNIYVWEFHEERKERGSIWGIKKPQGFFLQPLKPFDIMFIQKKKKHNNDQKFLNNFISN